MVRFNVVDLHSLQECLTAYKNLINWMPITCLEEMDLKEERLRVIDFLEDKCERALAEYMESGKYE
jgi:hypothetical protein